MSGQGLVMGNDSLDTRAGFLLGRCSLANASGERRAPDSRRLVEAQAPPEEQ
jgi:hypothetical protein